MTQRSRVEARDDAVGTILIVDDKVPEFDKHAGGNAVFHYVRLLVEHGFRVVYLPDDRVPRQPYTSILLRWGVEVLYGRVHVEAWLVSHGQELDWVLLARPTVAPRYIDMVRRRTRARLLYYTVDLHFLREMRRYQALGDLVALHESHRLRAIEQGIFRDVDAVLTPSADEVPVIKGLAPGRPVYAIPLYALRFAPLNEDRELALTDRTDIIFLGGFTHPPNVDAARFLVEEVMPLVWRDVPETQVLVVGNHPTPEVLALAGRDVSVTGYVPDLVPYFARARLSISPMRYGAGVKGKIVSSLGAGVPVVTTSIGNEGIGLRPDHEALLGDTAEQIAAHTVRILREPQLARSLSAAGLRFVMESFSEETTRDQLLAALGLVFCPVCGHRSSADRPTSSCPDCGADGAASGLADIVIRPYRRFRDASLRRALRHLATMRIGALGVGEPVRQLLATCPSFQEGPLGATDGKGPVDLLVWGGLSAARLDLDALIGESVRSLRVGGRFAFVVTYDGAEAGRDAVANPSPTEIESRLQGSGIRAVFSSRPGDASERFVLFDAIRYR